MFNYFRRERIKFSSNPPLPEEPCFEPLNKDGVIVNQLTYRPKSNHSFFEGISFSAETMSLRAKLNLGIPMSQVSLGQIENDPNALSRNAIAFEQSIESKLNELSNESSNSE